MPHNVPETPPNLPLERFRGFAYDSASCLIRYPVQSQGRRKQVGSGTGVQRTIQAVRAMGPDPVFSRVLHMSVRILLPAFLLTLLSTGCVHRRMTIQSDPPGALVKVDGRDVGYTPASVDFTYYGTREIQLLKDGFETQTQLVDINAPWYQRFPLDFVSDNFLGTHVRDHRQISIRMQPKRPDVSTNLLERGRSLRSEATHGL